MSVRGIQVAGRQLGSQLARRVSTLPRVVQVHHPNRIKENTLHPAVDVTIPEIPYCEYLWSEMELHGHLPGLVCAETGETLLHGEVREKSLEVSRSLRGLGLKKGDVVALLLPNCIQYPLIVQGCMHSGLVVTPLNPAYTPLEIARQLTASKATVIVTDSSLLGKLEEVRREYPGLKTAVIVNGQSTPTELGWTDFLAATTGPLPEQEPIDIFKDVAFLPFSSGTTGVPKGVMLSQHTLITNVATIVGLDSEYMVRAAGRIQDVTIGILPLYHIFGLNVTMSGGLYRGANQVVMRGFEPQKFAAAMTKYRPTFLHLVPPLVSFLASSPLITREHLSSLRQINCGAAPSGPELIKQFYKKAPSGVIYKEGWGSTEIAGAGTGVSRDYGIKRGSVNQLCPNLRVQVRDLSSDKPLGADQHGEILVKGPHVMLGYFNNPEANKTTFDQEGWMRTGDIGYYDQDGFLHIVDRLKELIKVKGLQVAPAELEDILRGLEGVADVGVVGVPSARDGESPRAFVVRSAGSTITEEDIHDYMKKQLAPHKQLGGGVQFVQEIPKSAAGKILRRELNKNYK